MAVRLSETILRMAARHVPEVRRADFLADHLSLLEDCTTNTEKLKHACLAFRYVSWILQQHYKTDFSKMLFLEGYTSYVALLVRFDEAFSRFPKIKFFLQATLCYLLAGAVLLPACFLTPFLLFNAAYGLVADPQLLQDSLFTLSCLLLASFCVLFFGTFHHFAGEAHNTLLKGPIHDVEELSAYKALFYFSEDQDQDPTEARSTDRHPVERWLRTGIKWSFEVNAYLPSEAFKSLINSAYTDTGPAVWARLKEKVSR